MKIDKSHIALSCLSVSMMAAAFLGVSTTRTDLPPPAIRCFAGLDIAGGEPFTLAANRPVQVWTFSVYATRFHGRTAANGSVYDHDGFTCASNNHAFGTQLHIIANGRCVMVEVTDRLDRMLGKTRIDLSGAAMKRLDANYDGTDETAGLLHGTATEADRKESK